MNERRKASVDALAFAAALLMLVASLVSCGLLVSFDKYDVTGVGPDDQRSYAVGGQVTGLGVASGLKVTLLLNGGNVIPVGDGAFVFPINVADGADYVVTLETPDASPAGHTCSVVRPSGKIPGAAVTDVVVQCPSNQATLESLSASAGALLPAFDPTNEPYKVETVTTALLPGAKSVTTVVATARDPGAEIVIGAAAPALGKASVDVPLSAFETKITVVVTAADRQTKKSYTITVSGTPTSTYVKASNTAATAAFGISVSLSGDTLAVGSPEEKSNATGINGDQNDASLLGAGAVYIFTRSKQGVWSQQAYLKASTRTNSAPRFGVSVALSGDTLVVGAVDEKSNATGVNGNQTDTSLTSAGAAYVFTRKASDWSQQAYLKASNTTSSASFGSSVAISGDTVVVGAEIEATKGGKSGAAYVFTRTSNVWSQQALLNAPNARAESYFGSSIAISGDTIAVGAERESSGVVGNPADITAPGAGAVFVFTRQANTWSPSAYVKASKPGGSAFFGSSVALDGDTLAVGSEQESMAGAAYVYTRAGTAWSQQAYLKASNARAGARFGSAVSLAGGMLAVGSAFEGSKARGFNGDQTDVSAMEAGAAYLFARTAGGWSQVAYLKASNTSGEGHFGISVALSADSLAVGAPRESSSTKGVNGKPVANPSADQSGAAYVFR